MWINAYPQKELALEKLDDSSSQTGLVVVVWLFEIGWF